ncbi:uncharacterized protein LOC115378143 [Myripristis murdjan]|uniref:uncharacterized protein LOC115378143 n=1 Tax=Myripristis murdjan TaxID=586833 RepID=UPI001176105D|nr:uncharacterized protein LOC115378143 [Myripristis murdjan]
MLSRSCKECPNFEECLQAVKYLTQLYDTTGTTNNSVHENTNKDRTHTTNCCPETLDKMDISETTASDQSEITGNDLMDSSSSTEEEFSECEGTTALEMSDEDEQQAEAEEEAKKESIQERSLSQTPKAMDQIAHGGNPQQEVSVEVKMSSNTGHQRIYDKKNYCLYCEKPFVKITRHLKQKHSNKAEVAQALAHKQGSAMHNLLLSKVRNKGNYYHNCSVLSSGKGQIIPKRQATYLSTATDYLPCKFCFAMYIKRDLWRHHKRCKLQVKEAGPLKRKIQASCSLLLPMDTTISSGLKNILEDMTYDAVTQVVKSDVLIISLGESMVLKNGEVGRHRADIRNKMRELARLVLVARTMDKDIFFLKDLISPGKFNIVLEAVKKMTGFDSSTNRFSVPSTALKLRHSLVKVSYILQEEGLRQDDDDLKKRAEQFSKLIELEWRTHVSSNALKTLDQKKWNSLKMLPLSEDIKKLHDHLKRLEQVTKKALIEEPSQRSWSELSQVTLTQLILFNRCEGEASRMQVTAYLGRNQHNMHDEVLESLSPFEKKLCEKLTRVEIRGKRGCKVPVLLPTNVKESVELLIKTRETVGIPLSNPYIFARPYYGSLENIRGCDCLKRFAEACGAKHPENITSTKLRKQIATVSQVLSLQTHELDQLANFMGHDIEVPTEFNRLPEETLQMAKMSRLPVAQQSGVGKFKGNTLEEITPNINSEEEFSDSDAEDIHISEHCASMSPEGNSEDGDSEERADTSRKVVGKIKRSVLPSSQKGQPRRPSSKTKREILEHHFRDFLEELKIPGSDQPEITGSVFTDSSFSMEKEFSECEMTTALEMSDEDEQQAEAEEEAKKESIQERSLSHTLKAMDQIAHGGNPQQEVSVEVKMSSNTGHQRIYDKKNYCLYCEKPFVKITRHLKQKHSNKAEVAQALAHKQGSAMHNLLLSKVRNKGNYYHNCSVLSSGKGQIIPKRQATYPSTARDYLPCKFCFAMYVKTDLWRHHKRCKLQVKEAGPLKRKIQASCSLLLPMNTTISSELKNILEDMTYDAVTQVVKSDVLIISLGESMVLKNGESGRHRADIRNKMRELARLVLVARTMDKDIFFLKDLISPGKFNTVLEAVKKMTGFDSSTNRFSVPSTALKLHHSLVKVSYILQGEGLRQDDDDLKKRAEQFSKLIELEWTTHVSSNALKTLDQKKWSSPQMLPLSEDIKKLHDHLKHLEQVNKKALIEEPSQRSWSELSQVTLTQLILFNCCHDGEASRMQVTAYLGRNQRNMHDEILESLSPFEKKLCEKLTRVEIRGKRGCKVPVLLPTNVKESVELLIKTRETVGIPPSNPYIFARPYYGSLKNIRGCDCLKRFAEACGAKHPENITSTKLRKQVATVSQVLSLQTHELDQLTNFMGHDIEVHTEFNRLPEETLQMAKMSRLPVALQSGVGKFKGNTLEEITPNINSEEEFSDSDAEDINISEHCAPLSPEGSLEDADSEERADTSRKVVGKIKKSVLPSSQKGQPRRPWSKTKSEILEHHFKDFLEELKIPGSDQPEITGSVFTDSSFSIEKEFSECEMTTALEMSDEDEQQAEEEAKKEPIQEKSLSQTPKATDQIVHGGNPQQEVSMEVKMSSNTGHQRIYDKKNYCLYCEKPFVKITRHLKQKHSNKAEVAQALAHKQGSAMHNLLLSKVRNKGNYYHNCSVLSSGKGQIIPKRQATYPSTATDYLPCKFCFAMYVKTDLWRHHKRCKLQVKEAGPLKRKIQASGSLLLPMDTTISSGLKNILEDMTYDAVTQVVKSDVLIISLGERMVLKNGESGRHRADIRNKMRELARLVLVARTMDKDIFFLKDLITPGKFNTVLEAVKKMTGFDSSTNRFSVPSTALKLRHSLVKVSYILQGEGLRQDDDDLKKRAEQFSKLIELEWTTRIIQCTENTGSKDMEQHPNAASIRRH